MFMNLSCCVDEGSAVEKAIAKDLPFVQWYSHPLPKDADPKHEARPA